MEIKKEEYKDNETKGEVLEVQCAECKRPTRHLVITSYDYHGSEEDREEQWYVDWSSNFQIIQCQGCMTVSYRTKTYFSEDVQQYGPNDYDDGTTETIYPKRSKETISAKDFWNIPNNLRRIYRETVDSFNNDLYTLCAAGLRALVEGLCAELGVTDGPKEVEKKDGTKEIKRFSNLEGKIAGLHEKGYLTQQHSEVLHEHRYMGNEAVHQLNMPTKDELLLAIEIIEHMFESVYEIPQKHHELQFKRKKRNKKT